MLTEGKILLHFHSTVSASFGFLLFFFFVFSLEYFESHILALQNVMFYLRVFLMITSLSGDLVPC